MLDVHAITDDYSRDFARLRTRLIGRDGERYVLFVRGLKPKYRIVYRDIAIGYALLAVSFALAASAPALGLPKLLAAVGGAVLIGYWVAHLQLFLHEASHYNLAPDKRASDRVCDLAISWLIGTTVATYRPVHFQHHRDLGTTTDTEFTYFFPLNLLFLFKTLFGVRTIEVLMFRRTNAKASAAPQPRNGRALASLAAGLLFHAAVVAGCFLLGWWWAALAWVLGIGLMFPFFAALRQLLEHRDETSPRGSDFKTQDHGAYTRLFSDGMFARTFGGAGFNRHLLHHWEPQVSYTNLPELEAFLEGTEVRGILAARRSTYLDAFRSLWSRAS
jgi:fatty acid desaturase